MVSLTTKSLSLISKLHDGGSYLNNREYWGDWLDEFDYILPMTFMYTDQITRIYAKNPTLGSYIIEVNQIKGR